jgi:hypothetical protein
MGNNLAREINRLMRDLARDHGCEVTKGNRSSHWKVTRPGCQPVFVSASPTNARGLRNALADLRRELNIEI